MINKNIACIILAAGKGTRMKSDIPKVLHELCGKSMLEIVIDVVNNLDIKKSYIVVGYKKDLVVERVKDNFEGLEFVEQVEQRGTGDAVLSCKNALKNFEGDILILCGDMPLVKKETLRDFIGKFYSEDLDIAVLSVYFEDPFGYGRIVRKNNKVLKIVEESDANEEEKKIKEINTGIYCVKKNVLFRLLDKMDNSNNQGEFYLTDIVELGLKENLNINAFMFGEKEEFIGINSRKQLALAENIILQRKIKKLQEQGVSFIKPETTYLHLDVEIGMDTIVYPDNLILEGSIIGNNCIIGSFNTIKNSKIYNNVNVKGYCFIDSAEIYSDAQVGPFSHLRPDSEIGEECRVGNFVEIKKSVLKKGVKASHLSYIGDAELDAGVNVGAGTITCNYDGFKKYKTEIGKNVFIGSDTQLVAPVKIGDYSLIAAGTTVTKDVPENSLVHSRTKQVNVKNRGMKGRK